MKYWTPNHLRQVLDIIKNDIAACDINIAKKAYLVKTFIFIEFSLGDRVGETRALTFGSFDHDLGIVKIKHSINYDRKNDNFLSSTKNYQSQREIEVTDKLLTEIN